MPLIVLDMALENAGVSINPGYLNTLLTAANIPFASGFVDEGILNWGPATAIAANYKNRADVQFHTPGSDNCDQALRDLIMASAAPIIVKVTNQHDDPSKKDSTHFVLVTGLTSKSFSINDPGYNEPIDTRRTELNDSHYVKNGFTIIGYVKDPPNDLSQLYFAADSTNPNLNLYVTDSQGRVTGIPPGATAPLNEIPDSYYFVNGPLEDITGENPGNTTAQFVYIAQPEGGMYAVAMNGTGAYTTSATSVSPDGQLQSAIVILGTSSPDTPSTFSINYDAADGSFSASHVETATALESDLQTAAYGDSLTFTANVIANSSGAGTPTGAVQFLIDGAEFGSPVALVAGVATSDSITTLTAGAYDLRRLLGR